MYTPDAVPDEAPRGLRAWLAEQLRRIANDLNAPKHLDLLRAEPARMYDGLVVAADGTNWNPGAGRGVYARVSGAWVLL
jgi:hypothetical protein